MINERLPRTIANAPIDPGFTFVELMVSFAIIGILSLVIIINQRDFDKTVNLKNIAHEISILLREQQSHATNVLANETTDSYEDTDRGVIINTTNPNNVTFQLFYDEGTNNGMYDSGDTLATGNIVVPSKYSIRQVCSFNYDPRSTRNIYCLFPGFNYPGTGVGQTICNGTSTTNISNMPTIVFARPLLQPKIHVWNQTTRPPICDTGPNAMINDRASSTEIDRIEIVLGLAVSSNRASPQSPSGSAVSLLEPFRLWTDFVSAAPNEPPPLDEFGQPLEIIVIEANGAIYVK